MKWDNGYVKLFTWNSLILIYSTHAKVYPNMRSAFLDIVQTRGFRGLYAGLSPTLVEIIPYAGLQFGTYDTFKRWTMVRSNFSFLPRKSDRLLRDFFLSIFGGTQWCVIRVWFNTWSFKNYHRLMIKSFLVIGNLSYLCIFYCRHWIKDWEMQMTTFQASSFFAVD